METAVAKQIVLTYGPLGLFAIFGVALAAKLYKDLKAERKHHAKEMREMQDRYIQKAETWMEKYHELVKSLNDVLDAISSRYERR